MSVPDRPSWQLPIGVARGTWDYVHEKSIATEYDQFHAGHPLLELDKKLIAEHLPPSSMREDGTLRLAMDIGCGPGRNLLPVAALGWRVMGIDLSGEMLNTFSERVHEQQLTDRCGAVRANMVQLDGIASDRADAIFCMYSSLGMVHGRTHRRRFLQSVHRILRPGGIFFVHVHNRGSWLRDPGGIRKTFLDWIRSKRDSSWELGDRIYPYRGLPSMFLHIYSERELKQDIASSGLKLDSLFRLDRESKQFLHKPWLPHLQCGGFIAVCRKTPT